MMRMIGRRNAKTDPRPRGADAARHYRGDPIDFPALRRMGLHELADLPMPRHRLPELPRN